MFFCKGKRNSTDYKPQTPSNPEIYSTDYKRQAPLSRFARIDRQVGGFRKGDQVRLASGSHGTVEWIGCYYDKKLEKAADLIVGVKLVSCQYI